MVQPTQGSGPFQPIQPETWQQELAALQTYILDCIGNNSDEAKGLSPKELKNIEQRIAQIQATIKNSGGYPHPGLQERLGSLAKICQSYSQTYSTGDEQDIFNAWRNLRGAVLNLPGKPND